MSADNTRMQVAGIPFAGVRGSEQRTIGNAAVFALGLCLSAISILPAQTTGPSYTIYGMVMLPDGNGAPRVTIAASGQTGLSRQVISDDTGHFEIRDLPRGHYTLTVTNSAAPDQYAERAEIEISRLSPPRVTLNLYLRAGAKVEPAQETKSTGISVAEAAQHVPKAAQKEFQKALKLGESRQFDKAIASFSRSIELYPEYFQAYAQRGHLLIAAGRIESAAKDFSRALEINSGFEPAMRGAGICKIQEGRYDEARRDLERAVSIEPRDAAAHLFLGFANTALDRRDDARIALQKALSLDPVASARAHVHLANLDLKENRNQEAARELEAYLAAVPNAPDAAKLRALLSQLQRQ